MATRRRDAPYEAGKSFEERLEDARRVKALSVRDVTDDISYFSRKRIQNDVVKERARKKLQEQREKNKRDRQYLGYEVWKEQQEKEVREKLALEKEIVDSRSESELRAQLREFRRQDRAHSRQRDNEYRSLDRERERREQQRAREQYESEKKEREERWARQEKKRDRLNLMRRRLNDDRKKREEQRVIDNDLRHKREQMAEERSTLVNSEWALIYERKDREKARKIVKGAKAQRTYKTLGLDGDAADLEIDSKFRETLRRKRRLEQIGKSVKESEEEMNETKRWYHNRALDRTERHYRTLHSIKG